MYETELYHYGVKGMRWGVRRAYRAQRKQIKQTYRDAKNKAFSRYEKDIANIEKSYKRGQNLSDRDVRREAAAEKRYADAVAKAKNEYKTAKAKNDLTTYNVHTTRHADDPQAALKRVRNYHIKRYMAQVGGMAVGSAIAKSAGYNEGVQLVTGLLGSVAGDQLVARAHTDIKRNNGKKW